MYALYLQTIQLFSTSYCLGSVSLQSTLCHGTVAPPSCARQQLSRNKQNGYVHPAEKREPIRQIDVTSNYGSFFIFKFISVREVLHLQRNYEKVND